MSGELVTNGVERKTEIVRAPPVNPEGVLLLRILNGDLEGREAILLGEAPFTIGASFENALRLPDSAVSRRHLELVNRGGFVAVRDLDSTNGSFFEGSRFTSMELGPGSVIRVGSTELQVVAPSDSLQLPPSSATSFGPLLGRSRRMREVFSLLDRAAQSDVTVLVSGETGTGKELVAEAIHQASNRARGPLVVVDCASIPENLIESELFGHVKGAFTHAMTDRIGAFEAAHGGIIFLDELGELPSSMQPRLLRALESRRIKRVGENIHRPVDVRVIAATNRDLADDVRQHRFRSDLYYRLAVLKVHLPPLRERREDIPLLVEHFCSKHPELAMTEEHLAMLSSHDWPGNIRELRNVVDQAASISASGLDLAGSLRQGPVSDRASVEPFLSLPFKQAKQRALEAFEEAYVARAMGQCDGNVSKAAERAGVHRNVFHRILSRSR